MLVKTRRTDGSERVEESLARVAGEWMALWTKPRQEKAVARVLRAHHTVHYLPLIERVSFSRGHKFVSMVPLFPGYVFMAGELQDAYAAVSSKRVCRILEVPDQQQFVHELEQIRQAMTRGGSLELYPFVVMGRQCRVVRGPFEGIEGVIIERLGSTRLILQVALLGRGAALEIDIDLLEPLD
jgi:transcription antitermination factor NusG